LRRLAFILSLALLAGCPKDSPEDDYQMPPLPQYDPSTPARPAPPAVPQAPLPDYHQMGPVIPAAPPAPPEVFGGMDGGAAAK
jgi:hypothetical protein